MDSEKRTAAIRRYADSKYRHEIDYQKQYNPERLAAVPQTELDRYRSECLANAEQVAAEIDDKTKCAVAFLRGRFHPSNDWSRRLFSDLTGIALPPTVAGTDTVFQAYCGAEIDAEHERKRIEQEAKESAAREAEQRKRDERKAKLSAKVAANESIPGDDLAELCGMLGIELHPRTIGTLRKRVRSINSQSATIVGKGLSDAAYHAYLSCAAAVS